MNTKPKGEKLHPYQRYLSKDEMNSIIRLAPKYAALKFPPLLYLESDVEKIASTERDFAGIFCASSLLNELEDVESYDELLPEDRFLAARLYVSSCLFSEACRYERIRNGSGLPSKEEILDKIKQVCASGTEYFIGNYILILMNDGQVFTLEELSAMSDETADETADGDPLTGAVYRESKRGNGIGVLLAASVLKHIFTSDQFVNIVWPVVQQARGESFTPPEHPIERELYETAVKSARASVNRFENRRKSGGKGGTAKAIHAKCDHMAKHASAELVRLTNHVSIANTSDTICYQTEETEETYKPNRTESRAHARGESARLGSARVSVESAADAAIMQAIDWLKDTQPSWNKWRAFISRYGVETFLGIARGVSGASGVNCTGAVFNRRLDAYQPPAKPKTKPPRTLTAKDWALCAERCRKCDGTKCLAGKTVPPDHDANWPHAPEECPLFAAR